jgi:murein DD-endopeptidase MepM/ murein hydrolase activator NlpD
LNRIRWISLIWVGSVFILAACSEASPRATPLPPSPTVDELSTLIAMQAVATDVPTATPIPTATVTLTPSLTPLPSETPAPTQPPATPTPFPTNTPRSTQAVSQAVLPTAIAKYDPATGEIADHYWLQRPFPRDPTNRVHDYLSRSYPYGTTGGGGLQVHHGVDIQNNLGTDILAVASGWVLYAGSDSEMQFGPRNDFYGNLVVIEHEMRAANDAMLYTLYGHMSQVDVETGQFVDQGEKIGEVGATGVALGSHLHLEVRLDDPYDYLSTYNPDLWLTPWPTFGTLAGRLVDGAGQPVRDATVTLLSDSGPDRYTFTYANDNVNPDPYYNENFTYGDLPEGEYHVIVRTGSVKRFDEWVFVEAGRTNWIDIRLD